MRLLTLFLALVWVLALATHEGARYGGPAWLAAGLLLYVVVRRGRGEGLTQRVVSADEHQGLTEAEYTSILVPMKLAEPELRPALERAAEGARASGTCVREDTAAKSQGRRGRCAEDHQVKCERESLRIEARLRVRGTLHIGHGDSARRQRGSNVNRRHRRKPDLRLERPGWPLTQFLEQSQVYHRA